MHIVYDSPPRSVVAHGLSETEFFGVSGLFGKPNIEKTSKFYRANTRIELAGQHECKGL